MTIPDPYESVVIECLDCQGTGTVWDGDLDHECQRCNGQYADPKLPVGMVRVDMEWYGDYNELIDRRARSMFDYDGPYDDGYEWRNVFSYN